MVSFVRGNLISVVYATRVNRMDTPATLIRSRVIPSESPMICTASLSTKLPPPRSDRRFPSTPIFFFSYAALIV